MSAETLAARARCWALWLTAQPSVTGTPGEQKLPHLLIDRIAGTPALKAAAAWLIPAEADTLARNCCAALVRGESRETVLLTGHFDTVTTDDYGDLAPLATEPEALRDELMARLALPAGPDEAKAMADFEKGEFLPGRGLLDMKAGLAAGLAALEAFADQTRRRGNLLFVAVPDEEVNSVGARALAKALPGIGRDHDLDIVAAVNLDCIADDGDGSEGRAVALGSVGKLLLSAYVVGRQSHASSPYQGLNAGAMAAALAARLEWADELADRVAGEPGIPPTLLSLKDGKDHYDVTTPPSVFATWNTLTTRRDARETLRVFRALAEEAIGDLRRDLAKRRGETTGQPGETDEVDIIEAAELLRPLLDDPCAKDEFAALGEALVAEGASLPDQNRRLTEAAWRMSGKRGPVVILGLGSLPYLPVLLTNTPRARRLRAAVDGARARASARSGLSIRTLGFFPGISDMSFLGQACTADLATIAANTPAWESGVRWKGEIGGVPIVNIGPWGRDYHMPLERVHAPYAFEVLPSLLLDLSQTLLDGGAA